MARIRLTARKSVASITHRETFQLDSPRPRPRAQSPIRLDDLALARHDRTVRRLRASNLERRKQVEDLTAKLLAAEKRIDQVYEMFQLVNEDNGELRESLQLTRGQTKQTMDELDRRTVELAEARHARVRDKERMEESWKVVIQLSENNQRLSKEIDERKAREKALIQKDQANFARAKNELDNAIGKILTHREQIAELESENQDLQMQLAEFLDPDVPEEDSEEEEAPPDVAVGNGEIAD
ncbi:uncharacterized protein LOC142504625 [Primulina tabacum]|uniref:uncharacterized protein LOC142504625 n=1 Tax=Primulina tabacum TaxID=48773 RepID=UPI003F59C81E